MADESQRAGSGMGPVVSVVAAAFNEERNVPVLCDRVASTLTDTVAWELLVVDDHSTDGTFEAIREASARDSRVRGLRLSRNRGSHRARLCGFSHARGDCVIGLAADLQDPPEAIPDLLVQWRSGHQVVWATRSARPGESARRRGESWLYRFVLRRLLGVAEVGEAGSSFLLLDRAAIDALGRFSEANPNSLALIRWMGFRATEVPYEQAARLHGSSTWTGRRKLAWAWNSVLAFSARPIRLIILAGLLLALAGTTAVIALALGLWATPAWAPPTLAVLVLGGLNLIAVGVVGEYLWQVLEGTRRRPRYLIEETVGDVETRSER